MDQFYVYVMKVCLQNKRSVVNTLIHRARSLPTSKKKKKEINHIKSELAANSYPPWILKTSKKTKLVETPEYKGFVVLPYYMGLAEKISHCLKSHDIKTIMKPIDKLENTLSSHKHRIDPFERQGAVYEIPCKDCNLVHVGETKRSFRTRKKEHIRDVRDATTKSIEENSTALCKHSITLDHELDWENSKVLTFETNYRKRKFIESFLH